MKKILIALMLVATPALAEEWFEMPNNAGGRIILLKDKCKDGKSEDKLVITTSPDGTTAQGCWINRGEAVIILWGDDTWSAFDQSQFKYRKRK